MPVTVTGVDKLAKRLRNVADGRKYLGRVGLATVQEAKALVPRRTGNLARTIRRGPVTKDAVEVHAGGRLGVGYAAAVEFGSRAHVVVPRRAKSLFFPSQKATTERFGPKAKLSFTKAGALSARSVKRFGAGAFVHAKRARIPAQPARPYLLPGMLEAVRKEGGRFIITQWNEGA